MNIFFYIFKLCGWFKDDHTHFSPMMQETLLNMWLVSKNGRDACLFATSDVRYKPTDFKIILRYANIWNLVVVKDSVGSCCVGNHNEFPRYLVYRKMDREMLDEKLEWHDDIARHLGISYREDDWWEDSNDRTCYQIHFLTTTNSKSKGPSECCLFVEMTRRPIQTSENISILISQWNDLIQSSSDFPENIFDSKRPFLFSKVIYFPKQV